jgi:hypothetical protein
VWALVETVLWFPKMRWAAFCAVRRIVSVHAVVDLRKMLD